MRMASEELLRKKGMPGAGSCLSLITLYEQGSVGHPNCAVDDELPLGESGVPVNLPHAPGGNLEDRAAQVSGNWELPGARLAQPAAHVVNLW